MGNTISPCLGKTPPSSSTKLVFYEGPTRLLPGTKNHIAGEIMFELPDKMVCHGDSFFIGHPLPVLSIEDDLMPGQTYFVLPLDRFPCRVLTVATIAALSGAGTGPVSFGDCPFEYSKGEDGRALIKVTPEFIERVLSKGKGDGCGSGGGGGFLCSTPELRKHYEQLVGSKEQIWSPKLETISEHRTRFSPCRILGLEWRQKEGGYRLCKTN